MKFKISPYSLCIIWSLNPKNQFMKHLPLCAIPLNVLWICIFRFLHIRNGVEATKLIPVHLPKSIFFMNRANGMATSFSVPQSGYMRQPSEIYFKRIFCHYCIKNLQKSSAIQNNSIILPLVIFIHKSFFNLIPPTG